MSHGASPRVCIVPQVKGVGGMVSFRRKLIAGLEARRVSVCADLGDTPYDAVLVIGGTRQLGALWRAKRRGVPIIQRLDGMNWLHRQRNKGTRTGWRHFIRAEYGNFILATIRARLASHIVYQSEFVRGWWERVRGGAPVYSTVIHNGVDLDFYTPQGPESPPEDRYRLLLVEGSLLGGYEGGLRVAVRLAQRLAGEEMQGIDRPLELVVLGRVPSALAERYKDELEGHPGVNLVWAGLVAGERVPEFDRAAHLLYSADLNAACPNSVIEALGCGLPVVSFDTGALPELVTGDAGRIAPYGGDPWQLDPPDVGALARAAVEVLREQGRFRPGARLHAEANFSLQTMVEKYLEVLKGV